MIDCDNPYIEISAEGCPLRIIIRASERINGLFWSRLCEELRSEDNRASQEALRVSTQGFISRRPLVRALCKQYKVGVRADESATQILLRAGDEENLLKQILSSGYEETGEDRLTTLATTRFKKRALKPFQERDLKKLLSLPHGANFSVPGAGKTCVSYALYELERLAGRVDRLLVIAPLSAFEAWETEAKACFEPTPTVTSFDPPGTVPTETEVLLVNYAKLMNHLPSIIAWVDAGLCQVILDEAHRIKKGRMGAWGSACLDLAWYASRRDVLTGTPAPQHPSDLEALLDFSWPSLARKMLPSDAFERSPPAGVSRRVADAVRPFFVRTRKSELGLMQPEMRVIHLELHGLQKEIYLAITSLYSGEIRIHRRDRYRLAQMGRIVMYLLEAATNPALLSVGASRHDPIVFRHPPAKISPDSNLAEILRSYGHYETPAKFRKLGEIIKENVELGRKTLIWSNFVNNLETLREIFTRYQPAMIHGGTPTQIGDNSARPTRTDELLRFRNDSQCQVLLANPAALGEGISLHRECHDAIYLERTFNAGQYLQSLDRIHRLGLAKGVATRITFLLTKDTIDEVVYARVAEKARRLGGMLDDPDIVTMALPDEADLEDVHTGLGQPIDEEDDVLALFAHLRGHVPS